MKISLFHSEADSQPDQVDVTWDWLANQALRDVRPAECTTQTCKHKECPHKYGLAWSPAHWPPGTERRLVATVVSVCVLVVDIDDVTVREATELLAKFQANRFVVTSSHSDRPIRPLNEPKPGKEPEPPGNIHRARRLRLVLDLNRPVAGRDWYRFWCAARDVLGLPADETCKDASRLFFVPSRPSDACEPKDDGTGFLHYSQDGEPLDVDAILAAAPPLPDETFGEDGSSFEMPTFAGAPDLDKPIAAAEVLGEAWPDEGRHGAQLALAGALARQGWPVELIAEFCAGVAEVQEPGNAKRSKRLDAARSSVEKARTGQNVAGWPTVIEYVGEDAVARARDLLGIRGNLPEPDPGFLATMTALIPQATQVAAASAPPPPAINSVDLDAALKSAQKRLASKKDPDSLRDAELLKRVNHGEFLTDDVSEDPKFALARAAIAVVRSAPVGVTPEQIQRKLLASAGALVPYLPEVVTGAIECARQMPSIFARPGTPAPVAANSGGQYLTGAGSLPLDEFVLETQGPRQGRPVPSAQHNFGVALRRLSTNFRYDEFARRKMILSPDTLRTSPLGEVVEDHHVTKLMFDFESLFDFYPPKDKYFDYTNVIAYANRYHPVLDYLASTPEWDGVDRTSTWLINFGGVDDTPYTRAVSRLFLVAAVRRVRQPGCKFDEMMILEGGQGTLKSSALKALCPNKDWFAEFKLDGDPKHFIEQSSGKWILEAAELKGMSNKEHADLKAQLSTTHDTARAAYAREPQTVARQSILAGTTNDSQYLRDPTGDRRYWPMLITRPFDLEGLVAIRDQLWAEAAYLDLQHPEDSYIRLHPSLWSAAAEEQDARKVDEPYEIMLKDAIGGAVGRIHVQDVWKLLRFGDRIPTTLEQGKITTFMTKLGFVKNRKMVDRERAHYYIRGQGSERDIMLSVVSSGTNWQVRVTGAAAGAQAQPPVGVLAPPIDN